MIFRAWAKAYVLIHSVLYFKIILEKPEPERDVYLDAIALPAIEMLLLNEGLLGITQLGRFMSFEICHDFLL